MSKKDQTPFTIIWNRVPAELVPGLVKQVSDFRRWEGNFFCLSPSELQQWVDEEKVPPPYRSEWDKPTDDWTVVCKREVSAREIDTLPFVFTATQRILDMIEGYVAGWKAREALIPPPPEKKPRKKPAKLVEHTCGDCAWRGPKRDLLPIGPDDRECCPNCHSTYIFSEDEMRSFGEAA